LNNNNINNSNNNKREEPIWSICTGIQGWTCPQKPLLCLPPCFDGCGAPFSIEHALDCRIGGLVGQRHNEVQGAFGAYQNIPMGIVKYSDQL